MSGTALEHPVESHNLAPVVYLADDSIKSAGNIHRAKGSSAEQEPAIGSGDVSIAVGSHDLTNLVNPPAPGVEGFGERDIDCPNQPISKKKAMLTRRVQIGSDDHSLNIDIDSDGPPGKGEKWEINQCEASIGCTQVPMKARWRFLCISRSPNHLAVDIHSADNGVDGTEECGIKCSESKRIRGKRWDGTQRRTKSTQAHQQCQPSHFLSPRYSWPVSFLIAWQPGVTDQNAVFKRTFPF